MGVYMAKSGPRGIGAEVLRLRALGYSYNKIALELNCSKSNVTYHCSQNGKELAKRRIKSFRSSSPMNKKMSVYKCVNNTRLERPTKQYNPDKIRRLLYLKAKRFARLKHGTGEIYMNLDFTIDELLLKIGSNPKCYLTGEPIDITKPSTYSFDHKIPSSRGGNNSLENLEICTKTVNQSKTSMTPDEYEFLCRRVLEHRGYTIIPPKEKDQP